jgi:ADP-ribose pyrophosphatase YjhB (NUDIX family)
MKRRWAGWLQRFSLLRWGLRLGVKLFVPRHYAGAVGVVFNHAGQLLLVEHVFRPYYPWGLPGGWIERGENPAETVRRELEEELGVRVAVKQLLLCEPQGNQTGVPPGLGLAYYCRLVGDQPAPNNITRALNAYEILSVEWVDPEAIGPKLTPLDRRAIILAKQEFDREQANKN